MEDVEETTFGVILNFNHDTTLQFSDPYAPDGRMMIWLLRRDGRPGEAFELTDDHRMALVQLFTPTRSSP